MKNILMTIFFLFTLLPIKSNATETLLNTEQISPTLFIQQAEIFNAEWSPSTNATPPKLLNYQVRLSLQDSQVLSSSKLDASQYPLNSSWNAGDAVEVLKEGFQIEGDLSWFRLKHLPSMQEIDFQGKSIAPRFYLEEGHDEYTYTVENIHLYPDAVHFDLKNTHFIYPIQEEKYPLFYSKMPLHVLEERQIEMPYDRYVVQTTVMDLRTNESFEITSKVMSFATNSVIKKVKASVNAKLVFSPFMGTKLYEHPYTLKITLEDGDQLTTNVINTPESPSTEFPPENYALHEGDPIEILQETPLSTTQSNYQIKNLRTNEIIHLTGPSRKPLASYPAEKNVYKVHLVVIVYPWNGSKHNYFSLGTNGALYDLFSGIYDGQPLQILKEEYDQVKMRFFLEVYNFETQQVMKLVSYVIPPKI